MINKLTGKRELSENGKVFKKVAFTLSETLIVVAILGVIATIVLPAINTKHQLAVNRTKIKKAMGQYEATLKEMIIENGVSDLSSWANGEADCARTAKYFHKVQGSGCIFRTKDNLWWNIQDIERPLVSLKAIDVNKQGQTPAEISAKAANLNDKTAFFMIGRKDSHGILRINDLVYEQSDPVNNSDLYVAKLYNYINNRNVVINNNAQAVPAAPVCDDYLCKYERGDYKDDCTNGVYNTCSKCSGTICDIYDENGTRVVKKSACDSKFENCNIISSYYDDGVRIKTTRTPFYNIDNVIYGDDSDVCDPQMSGTYVVATNNESCYNSGQCNIKDNVCNFFNEKGERSMKVAGCKTLYGTSNLNDISTCTSIKTYKPDGKTVETEMSSCDQKTGKCKTIIMYLSEGKTTMTDCDYKTGVCKSCTGPGCP